MFESISKFLNYWCFRYLLVTELYMVEKWERVMIHIVFLVIFAIISVINSTVVLTLVSFAKNALLSEDNVDYERISQLSNVINSEL